MGRTRGFQLFTRENFLSPRELTRHAWKNKREMMRKRACILVVLPFVGLIYRTSCTEHKGWKWCPGSNHVPFLTTAINRLVFFLNEYSDDELCEVHRLEIFWNRDLISMRNWTKLNSDKKKNRRSIFVIYIFEETSAYLIVKCYNVENCVLNLCDEYCTNLEQRKKK